MFLAMLIIRRCLSWHKDTNFKANHNLRSLSTPGSLDVCLGTKIRILKQITTASINLPSSSRCLSWHKDTNFKANHNQLSQSSDGDNDVCLGTKIRILKQITTAIKINAYLCRCLSWHKDTNFKANHNSFPPTQVTIWMFVLAQRYEF